MTHFITFLATLAVPAAALAHDGGHAHGHGAPVALALVAVGAALVGSFIHSRKAVR